MYKSTNTYITTDSLSIPINLENRHYQEVLDAIIEQGAACFDGDIPEDIQAAADEKQFNQQLAAYRAATARLAQYVVADGRPEITETRPTGERVYDEATGEFTDVTQEVVVSEAIAPVPATVEQKTSDADGNVTITTIENPLITKDNEERAAAQAVVDATPQDVKDAA